MKEKKIYVLGSENIGWSIDKDREHILKILRELKYNVTNNLITSKVIFCVWWNVAYKYRLILKILNKKLIVTVTNDLKDKEGKILRLKNIVNCWIVANNIQKKDLMKCGIKEEIIKLMPFYVNEKIFLNNEMSKKKICDWFSIDYKKIENKILIGSFQRDSQNKNLSKPRWQKNPQGLVNILKELKSNNVLLVLAGPGRHFIIEELKKNEIPYLYIGDESYVDNKLNDMKKNVLSEEDIAKLYKLIDLYIVTSKSEGGPKAIIEACLSKTMIISTDVGCAKDILTDYCIYDEKNSVELVKKIIKNIYDKKIVEITNVNYKKIIKINNLENRKKELKLLIDSL